MRIDGPGPLGGMPGPQPSRTSKTGARFTLQADQATGETGSTRSAATVSGLDAMLALQSVEDPMGRRRRALRRGHRLLDALDRLKLGLLEGAVQPGDAARLKSLAAEAGEPAGDPAIEEVLAEIDLRAQVEAAKLDRAQEVGRRAAGASQPQGGSAS